MTDPFQLITLIIVIAIPVVLAITVHEAAHGWVASRRGDPTAWLLGRVTFNPLKHIDPIGTLLVPLGLLVVSKLTTGVPLVFGWAKPVPVDWRRLRNPRWDMALVAAAGPGVNLVMAIGWGLCLQALALLAPQELLAPGLMQLLFEMAVVGILINLFLMALNLLPLLPLDGGRILNALLPPTVAAQFSQLERYGLIILLALLFLPNGQPPGLLGMLLEPLVMGVLWLIPGGDLLQQSLSL